MKVLLFLLFFLATFADEASVLVNSFGDASPIVDGKVNAITGDLLLSSCDLTIEAAQPLSLTRHYVSGDGEGYCGGWDFFPHTLLEVKDEKLYVSDSSGASLTFKLKETKDDVTHYKIDLGSRSIGYTNTSRGSIGGNTNLRNYRVFRVHKPKESPFVLVTADGTWREYYKKEKGKYLLKKERLPNGNQIEYSYTADDDVFRIATLNPSGGKRYAWMEFHYAKAKDQVHGIKVVASDGRKVLYHFEKKGTDRLRNKKYLTYLKEVNGDIPTQKFEYTEESAEEPRRIVSFLTGEGEGCVKYDAGRVKTLNSSNQYEFDYFPSRLRKDKKEYEENGKTVVVKTCDSDKITKKLLYDTYLRPYEISITEDFYVGVPWPNVGKKLLSVERFLWSTEKKQQGNLLKKLLISEDKLVCARSYHYDSEFNPSVEQLEAHIESDVTLSKLNTKRAFAAGDIHQLVKEVHPDGSFDHWHYLKGTNLVYRHLSGFGNTVKKRQFIRYNEDNLPVEIVTDDGAGWDYDDLQGVTERHFTRTSYATSIPSSPPEKIEVGYLDLPSRKGKILKTQKFFYKKSGRPVREETYDAEGKFAFARTWAYDKKLRLIQETDPLGRKTTYTYDSRGDVSSITDPSGLLTTYFSYDNFHNLCEKRVSTCDGQERKTVFSYKHHRLFSIQDHLGRGPSFFYDSLDRNCHTSFPDTESTSGPCRLTETKEFDILGHETKITAKDGAVTEIIPNFFGKPFQIKRSDGTKEFFSYSRTGDLLSHILPSGLKEEYLYDWNHRVIEKRIVDSKGHILKQERFAYSTLHLQKQTDVLGYETLYTYDGAGRLSQEQSGDRTVSYEYDPLGRLYKKILPDTAQITLYDLLDRVIQERTEDLSGATIFKVTYQYNSLGLKSEEVRVTGKEAASRQWRYDPLGRLVEELDPLGNSTRISYGTYTQTFLTGKQQTSQTCEEITTCDPEGVLTIERFDALDRLVSVEKRSPFALMVSYESYRYDNRGNLVDTETKVLQNGALEGVYHLVLTYDANCRLTSRTEGAGDPAERKERYTYDSLGRLEKKILPSGVELLHTYDRLGNLRELTSSDQTVHYRYSYDRKGQLLEVQDLIAQTTSKRSYTRFGQLLTDTLATGLTLTYSYNPSGTRNKLLLPDGSAIDYTYQGPLLRSISHGSYTHTYDDYDESGHLLRETHITSDITTYDVNKNGKRVGLDSRHTAFHIDLLSKTGNPLQENGATYTYDALNQLTSYTDHTYTYNSRYCRTSQDSTPLTTNIHGQILSAPKATYTYDANGNCSSKNNWRYTYDALGRMTSAISPQKNITYTYDSFNRRLSKKVNGHTTHFLYENAREIGSLTKEGEFIDLRILGQGFGAEIGAAVAIELEGVPYLPLHDLRGNITHLIDSSGTPLQTLTYNPFGEHRGEMLCPWGFSSKRLDPETDLYFFGNRYYDPTIGSWLTPDPLQTPYPYAFANNNPLFFLDLYGLDIDAIDTLDYPYRLPLFSQGAAETWSSMAHYSAEIAKPAAYYSGLVLGEAFGFIGKHVSPWPEDCSLSLSLANWLHPEKNFNPTPSQEVFGRTESSPLCETVHFNGIMTSLSEVQLRVERMNEFPIGNISAAYINSHGAVRDLCNSVDEIFSYPTEANPVALRRVRGALDATGPDGKVFMKLFSRGTIVFKNVAKHLTPQEKKRLCVYSYGGVCFFRRDEFRDVLNIVGTGDSLAMTALFLRPNAFAMIASGEVLLLPSTPPFNHSHGNATGRQADKIMSDRTEMVIKNAY